MTAGDQVRRLSPGRYPFEIQDRALRRLIMLNAAEVERDLVSPPQTGSNI